MIYDMRIESIRCSLLNEGEEIRGAAMLVQRQITHNTLHDEDPLPALSSGNTIHLHEAVGKDTAECIGEASNNVERAISLADIV